MNADQKLSDSNAPLEQATPSALHPTATATFAGGCFWGVEHFFRHLPGVHDAISGYIGGIKEAPSYREVCDGDTGHAEAVEVTFDPTQISYETLLNHFWQIHDPTTLNRQGPDFGTQYRSAIYFHTPEQEQQAKASLAVAQARFPRPIVTEITPASRFWPAEAYHQRYLEKHGKGSCGI